VTPPAQQRYDELVRAHLGPLLEEAGFKRSRTTFHRPVGANWEAVNLQKSAYSDSEHIRFTINVGVGIDRLRVGTSDWGEGKRPPGRPVPVPAPRELEQRVGADE
jgi:hypothetical protein